MLVPQFLTIDESMASLAVKANTLSTTSTQPVFAGLQKYQLVKIGIVAAGSLTFLVFLRDQSLASAFPVTASLTFITFLSEKYLRHRAPHLQTNWISTEHMHKKALGAYVIFCLVFISKVAKETFRAITKGQQVALFIFAAVKAGNLYIILLATVIGPILEEIVFRGFLQERVEDFFYLVSYVIPIPVKAQQGIACIVQAVLFGAIHMPGNALKYIGTIFLFTGIPGLIAGIVKNTDQSLLSPMIVHTAHNTGFTYGLWRAARLLSHK